MTDKLTGIYQSGMTPDALADRVLDLAYDGKEPSIPIDPFKLMKDNGIVYQFMEFKDLEGIYLVPEDSEDVAVVGINYHRPITRQRYTAAHELCHHIKDRRNEACPIGSKDYIEKYAENFAAALLMPERQLIKVALEYAENGLISMDGALFIAERFGVSFRACVQRLAYTLGILEGGSQDLNQRITKYKPDKKKTELGIDIENIELLKQAVDSYPFFFQCREDIVWYQFKNDFLFNENRIEGLDLDAEEVAEITADLRMNKQRSWYCNAEFEDIIQVAGHACIYDYIISTDDTLTIYKLLDLNKMLFRYAPFPEESGKTRTDNNLVLGTKFETVDWRDVANELIKLQPTVEKLVNHMDSYTVSRYVEEVMKVHHRVTQIHPFRDGNGRSSRALLNWLLRLKGLPPIYIKSRDKEKYYEALELADVHHDYKELTRVVIKELFRTIMQVNDTVIF